MTSSLRKEYEEEPVYYCRRCLSLGIKILTSEDTEVDYCTKCGCTTIDSTDIWGWKRRYFARYKKPFSTYKD